MPHVLTFNPLQFANQLKEAGVPGKQAEAQAEALREAFMQQGQAVSALEDQVKILSTETRHDASLMATKGDLVEVKADLKREIADVKAELKGDIADVKAELKNDIADVRSDIKLLKWMMGFLLAGIASLMVKSFT